MAIQIKGCRRFAALVFAALLLVSPMGYGDEPSSNRPNVIFIVTDDQRWDTLGCAGNPIIQTPHLDALAAGGVRFRNMFVTTSICAASRASILFTILGQNRRIVAGSLMPRS